MSVNQQTPLSGKVRELVLADFPSAVERRAFQSNPAWSAVKECGTELWLDTGDLEEAEKLWAAEFTGLTTNNTLLNKEVQKGTYDELVVRAAETLEGLVDAEERVIEIAFILNAYHALRLVHTFGCRVSVELHTDMAHDVERTLAYARRYWEISPEYFYVKVPMTPAGVLATRKLSRERILVNFTLGFGARQNYLATAVANPAFVNVFLGRLNSFVADNNLGDGLLVGEKATLASQRGVAELRAAGRSTRQIAASMREPSQVASLAGVDVFTMPTKVAAGYAENPEDGKLSSRTDTDYEVNVSTEAARVLWEIPDAFKKAVDDLTREDLDAMTPDGLVDFLAGARLPGLFPRWSAADLEAIAADGKIPNYERWSERLSAGDVALDGLINAAGLASFSADQKAMDDRIRGLL